MPDGDVYCYNYLLDVMQARYNETMKFHNYNAELYTFHDLCKTVKMIGLDKKNEVNLTSQQWVIHGHVFKSVLDAIYIETASCVIFNRLYKLFLFCYKVDEIMSGAELSIM